MNELTLEQAAPEPKKEEVPQKKKDTASALFSAFSWDDDQDDSAAFYLNTKKGETEALKESEGTKNSSINKQYDDEFWDKYETIL